MKTVRKGPRPDLPDIATREEVEAHFGLAKITMTRLIRQGIIPFSSLNGHRVFKRIDLEIWWYGMRNGQRAALQYDPERRRLLTLEEAAAYWGVTEKHMRQYALSGRLLHYTLGKEWLFLKADLDEKPDEDDEADESEATTTTPSWLQNVQVKALQSSSTGYVYILRYGSFYKIGQSKNVVNRLRGLKTQMPQDAELIHTIPARFPPLAEQYLHGIFADKRVNGEWFELTVTDVDWLKSLTSIDSNGTTL